MIIRPVFPKFVNQKKFRQNSPFIQSLSSEKLDQFYIGVNNIQNDPKEPHAHALDVADYSNRFFIQWNSLKNVGENSKTIKKLILNNVILFATYEKINNVSIYKNETGLFMRSVLKKKEQLSKFSQYIAARFI